MRGLSGERVVVRTDSTGAAVLDRPVNVRDFMATLCHALGIDPLKRIDTPVGREVPIVDQGGTPLAELFA